MLKGKSVWEEGGRPLLSLHCRVSGPGANSVGAPVRFVKAGSCGAALKNSVRCGCSKQATSGLESPEEKQLRAECLNKQGP